MNRLLPLGTVFKLLGSPSRIMIIGYFPINSQTGKSFQYIGTVYPLGVQKENSMLMFDEDAIGTVLFQGYEDETVQRYNDMVYEMIKNVDAHKGLIEEIKKKEKI